MDSFYKVTEQYILWLGYRSVFATISWFSQFVLQFQGIINDEDKILAARNEYNFDHPDAFDFDLLKSTLHRLKEGKKVDVPIYNFVSHARESRTVN